MLFRRRRHIPLTVAFLATAATTAFAKDPAEATHFATAFENQAIHAVEGRIAAGATTPVHLSKRGLNIWITDAQLEVDVQGGPTLQFSHEAGETQWLSSEWNVSITNLGKDEVRWLHVAPAPATSEQKAQAPQALPFQLLEPTQITEGQLYPLVVFLHGYGERGTDNEKHIQHGVPEIWAYGQDHDQPMFILAPQHDETPWHPANVLENKGFVFPETPSQPIQHTLQLIHEHIEKHPIDPNRIYVTGLSMGAFGAWDLVLRAPDLFAAAVPVAGGLPQNVDALLGKTPVWILHGATDQTVHPDHSKRAYDALRRLGHPAYHTVFPNQAHDATAWREMFSNRDVLAWMFAQHKNNPQRD